MPRPTSAPAPRSSSTSRATARRVLDLGCATGTTGAALKARQDVEVVGIELEPDYARRPRHHLDRVFTADAEQPPADLDGRFDVLIAADILEHLKDPWTALRAYAQLLEPGATAIVSLPNVAHWSTYAHLARGSWPRRPEGIFDATHLRWFTLKDASDLLEQAGLTPAHRRPPRLDLHARLAPRRARPAAAENPGHRTADHLPARHRRHSLTKVRDMDDIGQVRSFNRTVTERVGALQDTYLGRDRPLGANRVLWEIGDGTDCAASAARLEPRLRLPEPADRLAPARRPGRDRARQRQARARGHAHGRRPRGARAAGRAQRRARPRPAGAAERRRSATKLSRRWRPSSAC